MKRSLQKLTLALAFFAVSIPSAFAQKYPLPGKQGNPPVLCTGCTGSNSSGQFNDGLKTWPYAPPITNHTGRFLDSTEVQNFQAAYGIRTLRAKRIRIAPTTRGTAPPRAYIQLGSALAAYTLDNFFATLPGGMVSVSTLVGGVTRGDQTPEKVLRWDALIEPEASGVSKTELCVPNRWCTPYSDGQDRMFDFDFDDRGYVYLALGKFGWGIVKDTGPSFDFVGQTFEPKAIDDPRMIFVLKSGSTYYAVVGDDLTGFGRHVWDVTNPSAPAAGSFRSGSAYSFISWAKDDVNKRVAIVLKDSRDIEIYDYSTFALGGSPMATFSPGSGKLFKDVTVDESGNFWTSEGSNNPGANKIVKLERSGSTYDKRSFNVYGGSFTPLKFPSTAYNTIEYRDKYLAVTGLDSSARLDVRLFKIEGGEPVPIALNSFFQKYYWYSPTDHALPKECATSFGAYPIKWNNKVYLMTSTIGLGDVYQLQAGDSIGVSQINGSFGTVNPNAKSTESGPFYGDILKFTSVSSNPSFEYDVTWTFDNSESGAANTVSSRTGQNVTHQFTGFNNTTKITQNRQVKATATSNADMNDSLTVSSKVPTARIGIGGTNTVVTTDNGSLDLVAGDELTDASDGSVEGHYAEWTIDGTTSNHTPDETMGPGEVGAHTMTLKANYGQYNGSFVTTGNPYVDSVSNVDYNIRPFVISFGNHTSSGGGVTFKGTARKTALTSVLAAATWTVDWSLKTAGGADVVPPTSATAAVGTIPTFTAPNKAAIPSGSILTLKVSILPAELLEGDSSFAAHEIMQELVTPAPTVQRSGCLNTGSPCTLTVTNAQPGWSIVWILKKSGSQIGTFNGNPYTPTISDPGSYSATATATASIFEGLADVSAWTAEGPVCGDPPNANQFAISACLGGCEPGQAIEIRADPWNYVIEDCEQYLWSFGDGTSATTSTRITTHTYSTSGQKFITLTVKKLGKSSPPFTQQITVGSTPPPPECTTPSNITVSYSGSKGCGTGVNCKTGESVTFTARRGSSSLQTCDQTAWTFGDGDTSTTKKPSHAYSATGTYPVKVTISNSFGQSTSQTVNVPVVQDTGSGCNAPPSASQMYIEYTGAQSGCTGVNKQPCLANESISFKPHGFPVDQFQSCDQFEWNFGDNSAGTTQKEPVHSFAGTTASYRVSVRVYNTSNTTGSTVTADVPFPIAFKQIPKLTFSGFPTTGAKGSTVTFKAQSDINATGWVWDFGDLSGDNTQTSVVGKSTTVTHTYTKTGTFHVQAKARNAEDVVNAPLATVTNDIVVDEIPEYRYLLVAAHADGIGSSWRTDVQIYTGDPSVSSSNPLPMTASFKGTDYPLLVRRSTYIYEDFLGELLPGVNEQGAVIITVKTLFAPQIWTRTYNQTAAGTFGQFIPAIRLDTAGSGSATGTGRYYMAGLRSDGRYRTNVGLINPSSQAMDAILRIYDNESEQYGSPITRKLNPYQLDQFPISGPADRSFMVEVEIPEGSWVIAYASLIDGGSSDPVYMPAVRASELASDDYRNTVLPGIGHIGNWRSDVVIFNPYNHKIDVDLTYYDDSGQQTGSAPNVPVRPGEVLEYADILRQGVFGSVSDTVGMLRVTVPSTDSPEIFPMTFARTYNDNGTGKTYGQGIAGFASVRANVKPGSPALIPAVRSDASYRTNVGLTNLSNSNVTATVKVLSEITGGEIAAYVYPLAPNQSIVAPDISLLGNTRASLKVEVTGGNIWAFASIIDRGTQDPEYVPATPLP